MAIPFGVDPTNVAPKRLAAAAMEFGSYAVVSQVVSFAFNLGSFAVFPGAGSGSANAGQIGASFAAIAFASLIPWVYLAAITVIPRAMTGASVGQRIMGLVTVDESGQPVGTGVTLARALLGIIDGFPYCCYLYLVGGITMFTTPGHRRVADMIMKTYVVPKEYVGVRLGTPEEIQMHVGGAGPYGYLTPQASAEATWDPTTNRWVRWNGLAWETWDDASQSWRPV